MQCRLHKRARAVSFTLTARNWPARSASVAMTAASDCYDVLVAGAGPCGLTTALALLKACPDLKVKVLERAKAFRPSGGNIGFIQETYAKTLGAIDQSVLDAVIAVRMPRTTFVKADKLNQEREVRDLTSYGVSWFDLQQALLSQLPEGIADLQSGVEQVRPRVQIVTSHRTWSWSCLA
jgi:2-polyprenyl-6-methoxyphenol hydroxylase-like FAD-dependent oxidoreductase